MEKTRTLAWAVALLTASSTVSASYPGATASVTWPVQECVWELLPSPSLTLNSAEEAFSQFTDAFMQKPLLTSTEVEERKE